MSTATIKADTATRVFNVLSRRRDQWLTVHELVGLAGVWCSHDTCPEIRRAVATLVDEGFHIISGARGFCYTSHRGEVVEAASKLLDRAQKIVQRAQKLLRSVQQ